MADLIGALRRIDPAECSYDEWAQVGMALKHEGLPVSAWEAWSRGDPVRFRDGECPAKWATFKGAPSPVTGGTIFEIASRQGWRPAAGDREIGWDDVIDADGQAAPRVVKDPAWVEPEHVEEPDGWDPARQLADYLSALFAPEEHVAYVTESYERDGRRVPANKGCFDRTAGQLIEELSRCGGDIGAAVGDHDPEAGAWIRFNPVDGKGVRNENVTAFRHALVESDDDDVGRQLAIIRELELPAPVIVHSGGRSVHAIVRVDAADAAEYRKRVDFLYAVCERNGLRIDRANKNPSRLSRMPGATRGGKKQYIVARDAGKASWAEWRAWADAIDDDLPAFETIDLANLPELAPELVEGVLRRGHKMLLAGPSKAGKSFALIQLAIAVAEGRSWLGRRCAQGRVLYVNLEIDPASFARRVADVYAALRWEPAHVADIEAWHLRGKALPLDRLAPKLIRRAQKRRFAMVVFDPIYKIITGDENSADQMAAFCNHFDRVCAELGAAAVYCHHHSKGQQGHKRSVDRASGSGVFARDPDAMLDFVELAATDEMLEAYAPGLSGAPPESRPVALRVEGVAREFPALRPVDCWFAHPVHALDAGALKAAKADAAEPWRPRKGAGEASRGYAGRIGDAVAALSAGGAPPAAADVAEHMRISERTLRNNLADAGYYVADGRVHRKPDGGMYVHGQPPERWQAGRLGREAPF